MPKQPGSGQLLLRAFCACGHLGQWHHDPPPHPCARCHCQGFRQPTLERGDPANHWMPYHRRPRSFIPQAQDPTRQ